MKQGIYFSISHDVFHSFVSLVRQNAALSGYGLTPSTIHTHFNTLKKKASGKHCGKTWNCFFEFMTVSKCYITEWVNPFPNKPRILRVCIASFLKTLKEKEKLLITSNFSFSHSVFYLLENFLPFSSSLKLSSANSFSLEESKICCLGKG